VRTIKDLLLLDKTANPCLPEVAQFSLQHIINSESFVNVKKLVPSSMKKLNEENRTIIGMYKNMHRFIERKKEQPYWLLRTIITSILIRNEI
ncbi:hypothetical protein CN324_27270, partial [Bacillus anthracis]